MNNMKMAYSLKLIMLVDNKFLERKTCGNICPRGKNSEKK